DVAQITPSGNGWFLNTGVPHYVEFTDNIDSINVTERGGAIRYDTARFPQGTNVNFVQVTGLGAIRIRTYERGVESETLACGTGATAAALVTNFVLQSASKRFLVQALTSELCVSFERNELKYNHIRLLGNAHKVFSGVIETTYL
ncbi:MAG: diaminopimelate epimerase, partial [Alistipes sp.]